MSDDIMFDNFIVTDDREIHSRWVEQTWERKTAAESSSAGGVSLFITRLLSENGNFNVASLCKQHMG